MRNASNKEEINEQIRQTVQDTLQRHKWWDCVVPVFAEEFIDENKRDEYRLFDIIIKETKKA